MYDLEKRLLKTWDDTLFLDQYIPMVEKADRLLEQHDTFAHWLAHLYDALELVDLRSGEIRDREINTNCLPSWTGQPRCCNPTGRCWRLVSLT